jgi:hypothetical protein
MAVRIMRQLFKKRKVRRRANLPHGQSEMA